MRVFKTWVGAEVGQQNGVAGFEQAVKDSNQSELGRRNGGNMLSVQASERALLCYLIGRLNSLDPDVLVGHNVSAFDLDILLHRLQHHKVGHALVAWQLQCVLATVICPNLGTNVAGPITCCVHFTGTFDVNWGDACCGRWCLCLQAYLVPSWQYQYLHA